MAYLQYFPKENKSENQEIQEQIQEAINMIIDAKARIDSAINGSPHKSHYESYGCYGLDQALGNGNPYDSSLFNLKDEFNDMEITEQEFNAFLEVKRSGLHPMPTHEARELTNLSREKYSAILEQYGLLLEKFSKSNE